MLLLSYSADLLMLFVAWELMSIPTYALAGFQKSREESNEAAVKYAVLGALSSAIILYAISLTYGLTGTTGIAAGRDLARLAAHRPCRRPRGAPLHRGLWVQDVHRPFHMWAPDAYEGAPTADRRALRGGDEEGGLRRRDQGRPRDLHRLLVRRPQGGLFTIPNVLAVLALATMTLGNLAALTQKSMTRLLAYSSIAQAGYILIGFVIYSYGQGNAAFAQAGRSWG